MACLPRLVAIHPRAHPHLVHLGPLAVLRVRVDPILDPLDNMVRHIDPCIQVLLAGLRIATPLPPPLDPHVLHQDRGATDLQATTDHQEAGDLEVRLDQATVRKVRHSRECSE